MTAAARPQAITDRATEAVARHRAAAEVLAVGYRSALATSDPLAAFAGVAAAAWQSMCSRELSQVLAAAVQVIVERDEALQLLRALTLAEHHQRCGEWAEFDIRRCGDADCLERAHLLERLGMLPEEWGAYLATAAAPVQADRAGVDRHWGPLAATGGESL